MLTPRPYQLAGRDFLAARQFGFLGDEMRVGKTPQAIMACAKAGAERVLVTCPAIAVEHWRREFPRWYGELGLGKPPLRMILSYDNAKRDWQQLIAERWDVYIPDEAHFAKNPEAARTKLVYGKEGLGWHSARVWPLSGTPAPKHAGELWPMLRAFGAVGMTYPDFTRRYCTFSAVDPTRIIGTREEMIPELRAILAKVMLRRTRKDVAPDMPDIDFQFVEMKSVAADLKIPENVPEDQLLDWLDTHQGFDRENRVEVAMAKVAPLGDEIEFAIGNDLLTQTVVFGWHVEPLKALTRQLNARGINAVHLLGETNGDAREAIQTNFKIGTHKVVCAQILAAGTAVDLSAARHGYFLELDWVPGNNVQAANRLISMEKMDKVTIDVATLPRSADDRVQKVLLRRVRELAKLY